MKLSTSAETVSRTPAALSPPTQNVLFPLTAVTSTVKFMKDPLVVRLVSITISLFHLTKYLKKLILGMFESNSIWYRLDYLRDVKF